MGWTTHRSTVALRVPSLWHCFAVSAVHYGTMGEDYVAAAPHAVLDVNGAKVLACVT